MKKILLLTLIAFGQYTNAQDLENKYKVELGLQGISIGTEIPLSQKFLADVNLGWGGISDFSDSGVFYEWSGKSNSIFARGQVRYYFNRERRQSKGHSLKNNAGTFLAFQTKYYFSGIEEYEVGKYWLNELQFGQQLPMGNHFIFRYHLGIGNANDLDYNYNTFYPTLGFAFGYSF